MNKLIGMNKVIGAVVLAAAGFFLVVAGGEENLGLLFAGIGLGVAGLAVWDRNPRESTPVAQAGPHPDRQIARLEEVLLSLQEEVRQLRDDREFFHELYTGREDAGSLPTAAPPKQKGVR